MVSVKLMNWFWAKLMVVWGLMVTLVDERRVSWSED